MQKIRRTRRLGTLIGFWELRASAKVRWLFISLQREGELLRDKLRLTNSSEPQDGR